MTETISLPYNGWRPRAHQLRAWNYMRSGGRRAVCIWHRRAGKDEIALHWAAIAAHKKPGTYWHMLPEQSQARKAIWNAVNPFTGLRRIDEAFGPEDGPGSLRSNTRDDEMLIRFKNGSTWQVVGSDNYNSLVGSSPAGIVFSEYALALPASWAYLRPILAQNGGWAMFISTPRGNNHLRDMYVANQNDDDWFCERIPATQTDVFTKAGLQAELHGYMNEFGDEQGRNLFEQEYMCSFDAAIMGAFYAEELRRAKSEGRIGPVPAERGVLVQTAWDLGFDDATAIWFIQTVGREIRIVDYYEASEAGLDHYAGVLHEKARDYGWKYGTHWLPHDVQHNELGTGTSRLATLRSLGIAGTPVPVVANVADGVNATRRLLARSWIDEKRCERGIQCLANYRRKWDDKLKSFSQRAIHDWSSHGCDALRTFAEGTGDFTAPAGKKLRDAYDRKLWRRKEQRNTSAWAS